MTGFRFRGGHHAIDLPATLQGRLKPTPRELLETPDDLGRWLAEAGLAETAPDCDEADLATARRLREAIYALAGAVLPEGKEAPEARETLNRLAAAPAAVPVLRPEGGVRLEGSAAALLATIARDAVHLFGGEDAQRIRQCHSPTCTLFFVDRSRSGKREWCSMTGCGNKAKVAAFRERKRGGVL